IGIDFIHPDDLESTRNEMRLARRGRAVRNFESRYVHKDGRAVTLAWSGVWSEPEQQHFFIGHDTTARKRLEEAERSVKETLAAVIDASPEAIICLAADRTVIVWNRTAEQVFGYKAQEIVGRPYPLVQEGHEAESNALVERALAGETLRDVRVQRRRKDGSLVDISFDAATMYDSDGVRGVAYALVDITERNKLEQQLRHAQKLEAVGQLTGGVAHDFNNVLTVIIGMIELMAESVADDPELASIAKMIDEAAERGAELTRQLLAFARKQPLQPREIDINSLLIETVKLLRPTLGENVDIESMLGENIWPALVDPAQLSTALLNLALNARDAMPNGGKLTLETDNVVLDESYVRVHSEVEPGAYVMIAFSDTGSGIPAAVRDKVFEPFFATKDVGKGTGLGLSMVYGFVKQSGGHINIYSEERYGTTIKLYLPRAGEHANALPPITPVASLQGGRDSILVVEDDPLVRNYVIAQLENLDYATLFAANAAEALQIIDQGSDFDLLFTDVIMAGTMNGPQLADEIVKRRPAIKVLYTSGYTDAGTCPGMRSSQG
ncbi:MAG: PAS domain S-box protein, partial [Pseudorhodoplanes sp.]|nr:PAS domain S-box protein [Pseudorhodoplanes sp.]